MTPGGAERVRGRSVLGAETLRAIDPGRLAAYVRSRRWFGEKAARETLPTIRDVIPVDDDAVVARLEIGAAIYQLPLAARRPRGGEDPEAVLAIVDGTAIVDAATDEVFRRRVGAAFSRGAAFRGDAATWVVEPAGKGPGDLATLPSRLSRSEQSNTSWIYGDRAILKLLRKLAPGPHPELEISSFLSARTSFRDAPALLGAIRFEDGEASMVAGILHELVVNDGDAWAWALDAFRDDPGGEPRRITAGASALGALTRSLHEALASDAADPAFVPEPVEEPDVARWAARAGEWRDRALDALERVPASASVRAARGRRDELDRRLDGLVRGLGAAGAGCKIRTHGDYHLGQVLRRPDGRFVVTDFEGEPARPLEERRRKEHALRDVAGMLRSFGYAAAVGAREGERAGAEAFVRREEAARRVFLDAYFARGASAFLPATPAAAARFLALFEAEKLFYEVAYEAGNRPGWVDIPLGGVLRWLDDG